MIESSAATTVQQAKNIHNSLYFAISNTKSWHGKNMEHWLTAISISARGSDDASIQNIFSFAVHCRSIVFSVQKDPASDLAAMSRNVVLIRRHFQQKHSFVKPK